jgi:2'-5' RNA ligase
MPLNGDTLGCFALVSYIPEPLAGFIDRLRIELIPNAKPRAHVTILPPRPYCGEIKKAIETIQQEARELAPFTVELGDVEIFPQSHVVYLSIRAGAAELKAMYCELNSGQLAYKEPFIYHPHITLAQNIGAEEARRLAALVRERWEAWDGPRSFTVSLMLFVQQVAHDIWADVAPAPLLSEFPVAREAV